ncbi:hypothetical protein V502_09990 [Pseudogymnoascus sp. VKM F-4520 (FW-2644)]|nr:hypothetical protein V502_09990 [Pseudogymnoascus sp. VKM F-4520 (FW-2644)]
MNEKDVHWDSRTRELYHKNGVLCYTPRYYGQTVLQYVPIDATFFGQMGKDLVQTEERSVIEETSSKDDPPNKEDIVREVQASSKQQTTLFSSRKAKVLKGTLQDWHERMGHLNHHAVAKLQQVQGVEITNKEFDEHCETCRLAKAQRIISRIPTTRSTIPYEKIHFDLIPIYEGYIFHINCDAIGMNHLWILHDKKEQTLIDTLSDFIHLISTRFGLTVRTLQTDDEQALGNTFHAFVRSLGIIVQNSAPYSQSQNGNAERNGQVLIVRARTLSIASGLPLHLQKEMYIAASYILNRSPQERLKWKSPYQALIEWLKWTTPLPLSQMHNLIGLMHELKLVFL